MAEKIEHVGVGKDASPPVPRPREPFERDLRQLINRHCLENESNTPDFILAEYMLDVLDAFTDATKARERWYGASHKPANAKLSGGPRSGTSAAATSYVATKEEL